MSNEMNLTESELEYVNTIKAEMEFYNKYKSFMKEVKAIFLNDGPEVAKKYIRDSADHLLGIACDELFWKLFTKL